MDHRHHSHHHHGSDRRDDEYDFPPPGGPHAPPSYGVPPPPQVYHTSHSGPDSDMYHAPPPPNIPNYGPPPPNVHSYGPPPPNPHQLPQFPPTFDRHSDNHQFPPTFDRHSDNPQFPPTFDRHSQNPQFPPTFDRHSHAPQFPPTADHQNHGPQYPPTSDHRPQYPPTVDHQQSHHKEAEWAKKPSVRMYSKADRDYSLSIRDGKVILTRSNPADPLQHWVKDEKYSIRVKDEEGYPSFALVNKATGQAIKHATGGTQPVQLIPYNPDILDESILWTESKDLGDGYRTIRMVNNIRLNVDAFNGDEQHGGVHDGTTVVLWEWKKGANQRWKIVPH